mmetsp:Transcript_90217/g.254542  ORF Transcript_90217/g.254542 Transcript_90217/m.254542 type:complete len:240 (-) Transcript_90217:1167-1886(-)
MLLRKLLCHGRAYSSQLGYAHAPALRTPAILPAPSQEGVQRLLDALLYQLINGFVASRRLQKLAMGPALVLWHRENAAAGVYTFHRCPQHAAEPDLSDRDPLHVSLNKGLHIPRVGKHRRRIAAVQHHQLLHAPLLQQKLLAATASQLTEQIPGVQGQGWGQAGAAHPHRLFQLVKLPCRLQAVHRLAEVGTPVRKHEGARQLQSAAHEFGVARRGGHWPQERVDDISDSEIQVVCDAP